MTDVDQALDEITIKHSCSIHWGMKRKGIGPKFSSSSNCNRMVLWSKVSFGRILEDTIFLSNKKVLYTRNLSSRAKICDAPILLLVHVYKPFLGLKSMRSHCWITCSTRGSIWSLILIPLVFSFGLKTRFRSLPIMMFKGEMDSIKSNSVCQRSFFSRGWTGTKITIQ